MKNREQRKEEREARREQKRKERLEKFVYACPHCGQAVMEHMTKCPHCGEQLSGNGYQPLSDEKRKKIQIILFAVGMVVAIAFMVIMSLQK